MANRKFTVGEIMFYTLGWAILAAFIALEEKIDIPLAISLPLLVVLPPVLVGGALGFLIGGRAWFGRTALYVGIGWFCLLVLPVFVLLAWWVVGGLESMTGIG